MKLWELFKEAFTKYFGEWVGTRREKGWKANLFFIPLILAIVVIAAILVKIYIPPEWL